MPFKKVFFPPILSASILIVCLVWLFCPSASKPRALAEPDSAVSDLVRDTAPSSIASDSSRASPSAESEEAGRTTSGKESRPAVTATRRMIAAHAVLREFRISEPDSVENQRMLQAMVLKAISLGRGQSEPANFGREDELE